VRQAAQTKGAGAAAPTPAVRSGGVFRPTALRLALPSPFQNGTDDGSGERDREDDQSHDVQPRPRLTRGAGQQATGSPAINTNQ